MLVYVVGEQLELQVNPDNVAHTRVVGVVKEPGHGAKVAELAAAKNFAGVLAVDHARRLRGLWP